MTRRSTIISLVMLLLLVVVSGLAAQHANAAVTLESFTATAVDGDPTVLVEWVTATEMNTAGFYLTRSLTNTASSFERLNTDLIPAEGNSITGSTYDYTDLTTDLNTRYYYMLEVINNDQSVDLHGPISVIAGVAATPESMDTPTATPTRMPKATRAPTSTPLINLTPSVLRGETITPQPSSPEATQPPTATELGTRIALPKVQPSNAQAGAIGAPAADKSLRLIPSTAIAADKSLHLIPSTAIAAAPALTPTDPTVVAIAPVVISTRAPDDPPATASSPVWLFLIIIMAVLLLIGGLYTILRQAGK